REGRVELERASGWARLHDYGEGQYGAWEGAGRGAVGPRRLEDPVPMTAGSVFDLASVTKVMATTFAVMLLVDDGVLDLDAPVHAVLPDFTGGGKDAITPRHLLTHRSGLAPWQPIYYHAADPAAAYARVRDLPLQWSVGEGRHYSDLGFMVLGTIVERLSGGSLDAFLRERLYGPLGLQRTGYRPPPDALIAATSHGNPYEHRMVHDTTFGYRYSGDPDAWEGWRRHTLVGEVNDGNAFHAFGGVAGHAGLFSTAAELRVLLELLLERGEREGRRYLRAETVELFLTSTGDGQALGWQAPAYAPEGSFAHTGFTGTFVLGVPSRSQAVVLLTNRQNVGLDSAWAYPDVGPLQRETTAILTGLEEAR
ncbi:MAG TPA: serine hydrolase domain-containing protein, partial [Longimicrobiales bacterium]|nr:serine hydrolase domain-containing protein [Longimicrobiales bacterium]